MNGGDALKRSTSLFVVISLVLLAGCRTESTPEAPTVSPAPTIAFLRAVPGLASTVPSFMAELREAGFSQGRGLTVFGSEPDEAYAEPAEVQRVVAEWRSQGVDLIVALSSGGAINAGEAAPDVNILFLSNDPVAVGLVRDEQRPEGRATGVTFRVPADRTLDLARRVMPELEIIGLAYPEDDPVAAAHRDMVIEAGDQLGIVIITETFAGPEDVGRTIAELESIGLDALVLSNSPSATLALEETRVAAADLGVPVIATTPLAPWALIALSPDTEEVGRQLARQAARLLSGSSPSAVPVEDPRRFILTVNLDSARALNIEIPDDLLREATEVLGS
jgi:putative tryptophan/tyrosine transport system substrate-binding protein